MPKKPTPARKSKSATGRAKKSPAKKPAPAKQAPKAAPVPVVATIRSIESLSQLPKLAKKLENEGMTVNQVMTRSGVISGSCPADQIAVLNAKVPGVVVEPELTAHPS